MKRKLLLSLVLLMTTVSAKATTESDYKAQADLIVLKKIVTLVYEGANNDANEMRDRAYEYNDTNYFKYGERYQLITENCQATKALAPGLIMIVSAMQNAKQTLATTPIFQTPQAEQSFRKFVVYAEAVGQADKYCAQPTKSLIELRKGISALTQFKTYLNSVIVP